MSYNFSCHVIERILERILDRDSLVDSLFFGNLVLINGAVLLKNGVLSGVGYVEHLMDV